MNDESKTNYRIGLALGSGSSRGWSHIGIIKALSEIGIDPDIVCGCSVGALVGASYIAGNLDKLEQWLTSLSKLDIAKFFELNFSLNGFVNTERLQSFFQKYVCNEGVNIESLPKKFAAVSTDLETGREIWFTEGSVIESVWASISLPGLFPPIRNNGRWLVDGGLVNPVPVSVCRALGADVVIAVNLNGDIVGKHFIQKAKKTNEYRRPTDRFINGIKEYSLSVFPGKKSQDTAPSLFDAIAGSLNITQDRITRSRMAGDPPDLLLAPKLSDIGLLEFYRAREAIKEGEECVNRMLPEIRHLISLA
jgi:NTE family protein